MNNQLYLYTDNHPIIATSIIKENAFVVDKMDYVLSRKIHHEGLTYGPSEASILSLTLRLNASGKEKIFYEDLIDKDSHVFTLVFDPTFDNNQLSDYRSMAIMSGYVVEVDENYACGLVSSNELSNQQMLINVKIQLDHVRYMGIYDNVNITLYDN